MSSRASFPHAATIRRVLLFAAVVVTGLALWRSVSYYSFRQNRSLLIEQRGQATVDSVRQQLDDLLSTIMAEGQRLGQTFGTADLSPEEVLDAIRESSLRIPELQGVTACYEPDAFGEDGRRLYCPYYNKGTASYLQVEDSYDYTQIGPGTAWYTGPRDHGAQWAEPYYATAAQDWYVDYGVPFHFGPEHPRAGHVRGTITMSQVADGFRRIVQRLSLGKTGLGLVSTRAGTLLSHPVTAYVGKRTLQQLIADEPQPVLANAYADMQTGASGHVAYYDPAARDDAHFYYTVLSTTGWSVGSRFYSRDLVNDDLINRRHCLLLAGLWSLVLVLLIALYFAKDHLDKGEIWWLSALVTLLLLANLVYIGTLQHRSREVQTSEETPPITNAASLGSFMYAQELYRSEQGLPQHREIPTGIFLRRLNLGDTYQVEVAGTVWQKYPLGLIDSVRVGFALPQLSPFSEAEYLEEVGRDTVQGLEDAAPYVLVHTELRATLLLNHAYRDFPFDNRHLSLQLQPLEPTDHLVFVPDLASYDDTSPRALSGVDRSLRLSGSELLETYYNYTVEDYRTDFGYLDKSLFAQVPSLHFNLNLKRTLLNAFVTNLIPVAVTLLMMFILLSAATKSAQRQGIVESMAAFFFVIVFSHIDLRREIATAELLYMEYFYFVTYFMMLLATANLMIYTKDRSNLFDFNDNQLFIAGFFPTFLMLVLVLSWWQFY